jgi:hypothetical protein
VLRSLSTLEQLSLPHKVINITQQEQFRTFQQVTHKQQSDTSPLRPCMSRRCLFFKSADQIQIRVPMVDFSKRLSIIWDMLESSRLARMSLKASFLSGLRRVEGGVRLLEQFEQFANVDIISTTFPVNLPCQIFGLLRSISHLVLSFKTEAIFVGQIIAEKTWKQQVFFLLNKWEVNYFLVFGVSNYGGLPIPIIKDMWQMFLWANEWIGANESQF